MIIRVFLLLASVLCACNSTGENQTAEEVKSTQEQSSKEIVDVIEYHPNGAVKLRGKSQGGKRIGKWESFYPTGYRWSESMYRDGYRQGDAVTYYPNGMMRYQGRYYNGEKTGIWTFYDTTGVLIKKVDMDLPQKDDAEKTDSTGLN
jgi:antitoxin component YwqK of YwqJK toxin-antitoxin module